MVAGNFRGFQVHLGFGSLACAIEINGVRGFSLPPVILIPPWTETTGWLSYHHTSVDTPTWRVDCEVTCNG